MPIQQPIDPVVQDLANQSIAILNSCTHATHHADGAKTAFGLIRYDPNLSDQQKEQALRIVAKHCADAECDRAHTNPGTLMRQNTAQTFFIKEVVTAYSGEYQTAVANDVENRLAQVNLPGVGIGTRGVLGSDALTTDQNVPRVGQRSDGPEITTGIPQEIDPLVAVQWDGYYDQGGQIVISSVTNNLDKLGPQAMAVLEECNESVRNKFGNLPPQQVDNIVANMNSNNVLLRVGCPAVLNRANAMNDPIRKKAALNVLQVGQSYFNQGHNQNWNPTNRVAEFAKDLRDHQPLLHQNAQAGLSNVCSGQVQSTANPQLQQQVDLQDQNGFPEVQQRVYQRIADAGIVIPGINLPPPQVNQVQVNQPQVNQPQVNQVGGDQPQQAPARRTVGDLLRAAKESIKAKLGLDDESKLRRAQKQLRKRTEHLNEITERRNLGREALNQPLMQESLTKQFQPVKFTHGTQEEIAEQQNILAARELGRNVRRLEARVTRNDERVNTLTQRVGRLQQRVNNQQGQQQGHQGHGL